MGNFRFRGGVVIAALCGIVAAAPPEPARTGRLEAGGGGIAGDLVPVPELPAGVRDTFLWKSPRFAEPFEFRIDAVGGMSFPPLPAAAPPAGAFVRLRGGDVLAGTVESLDADALVVSTAGPDGPQRLRIERGEVAAISRVAGAGGGYRGPRGLDGWEQTPVDAWRDEAGRVMTDKPIAKLARDVGAPARARYDLRLSRRGRTEFVVALSAAADGKGEPTPDGYSLQAICVDDKTEFMLVRRSGGKAKLEEIPHAAWRGDDLRVVIFVDQQRGRLAAVLPDADGKDATRVTETILPPDPAEKPSGRFRLECSLGGLCLERLDVDPWLGDEPTLRGDPQTSVVTRAGALEGFTVASYDAASGEYLLERGDEKRRLAAAELDEIRFPDGADAAQPEPEPALRVVRGDGTSLAGDLVKVDERSVWLRRRGIDVAVAVPRDAIVAIRRERSTDRQPEPAGRVGTLVAGEDRVRGWIAPGETGVAWRPLGCENAVALAAGIDAEIEYVPRPPRPKAAGGAGMPAGQVRIFGGQVVQGGMGDLVQLGGIGGQIEMDEAGIPRIGGLVEDGAAARDGRVRVRDRIVAIAPAERKRFVDTKGLDADQVTGLLRGRVGTKVRLRVTNDEGDDPREVELARGPIGVFDGGQILAQSLAVQEQLAGPDLLLQGEESYPAVIVLRSGDRAECLIEAVAGDVVVLRTPLAADPKAAVRVPGGLVKAVELLPSAPMKTIDQTLRDRLLTLPRMQRESPPTHLLRLVDADYVRGRLVKVDERTVEFEMLGNLKKFPRERVARIIWLHPELPRQADAAAEPPPVEPGLVAQSVAPDGRRMTLVAEGVEGNSLRGQSRAFGASAIDLTRADRLLLGAAVGRDVTELPFGKWTLKPAPEPRALATPPPGPPNAAQ